MNVINNLKSLFSTKAGATNVIDIIESIRNDNPPWMTNTYNNYVSQGYQGNPFVYSAIKYISRNVASTNWKVVKNTSEIDEQSITTSPLLDLLMNPNETQGRNEFIENIILYLLLHGNSYIWMNSGGTNRPPAEMLVLPPEAVKPIPGTYFGSVAGYEFKTTKNQTIFPVEEIIHLKELNPSDQMVGMSPLQAARRSIDLHNSAKDYNKALLANGAKLSGALIAKNPLSKEQRERLEAKAHAELAGQNNAGKLKVFSGDLEWIQFGVTPNDLNWSDMCLMTAREIAIVNLVPGQLLGLPDVSTYSNYKEARQSFIYNTVLPLLDLLESKFDRKLTPHYGDDIKLVYDRDSIEELADYKQQQNTNILAQYQAGLITREEARLAMGLSESPANGEFNDVGI